MPTEKVIGLIPHHIGSKACMDIASKLREQGCLDSPIDLALERAEPLNAGLLQWNNFYVPPSKLILKNTGDTVRIRGQWSRHRWPTLSNGPLEGRYIFSHLHYHWSASPCHKLNRHTIDGKDNFLEMHALFYKSCYQSSVEAQQKKDGLLIVVYFFKVKKKSTLNWMTDQLENVTAVKSTTQLPPVPLSALMLPFTENYLAYWGALSCSCHHILWLVSRNALRITKDELDHFYRLKMKDNIQNLYPQSVKTPEITYHINPSIEIQTLLLPGAFHPPFQIITRPDKLKISVAYPGNTNEITETCCEGSLHSSTSQEIDFSISDSHLKNVSQHNVCSTNDGGFCCGSNEHTLSAQELANILDDEDPEDTASIVALMQILEREVIKNDKKIKELESQREIGYHSEVRELESEKIDDTKTRELFNEERIKMLSLRETSNLELNVLSEANKLSETSPGNYLGEANYYLKRQIGPNHKGVLTSRPNSVIMPNSTDNGKLSLNTPKRMKKDQSERLQRDSDLNAKTRELFEEKRSKKLSIKENSLAEEYKKVSEPHKGTKISSAEYLGEANYGQKQLINSSPGGKISRPNSVNKYTCIENDELSLNIQKQTKRGQNLIKKESTGKGKVEPIKPKSRTHMFNPYNKPNIPNESQMKIEPNKLSEMKFRDFLVEENYYPEQQISLSPKVVLTSRSNSVNKLTSTEEEELTLNTQERLQKDQSVRSQSGVVLQKRKNTKTRGLFEEQRSKIFSIRETSDKELKRLSEANKLSETSPGDNLGDKNYCSKQPISQSLKGMLTSRPNSVSKPISSEEGESSLNTSEQMKRDQSERSQRGLDLNAKTRELFEEEKSKMHSNRENSLAEDWKKVSEPNKLTKISSAEYLGEADCGQKQLVNSNPKGEFISRSNTVNKSVGIENGELSLSTQELTKKDQILIKKESSVKPIKPKPRTLTFKPYVPPEDLKSSIPRPSHPSDKPKQTSEKKPEPAENKKITTRKLSFSKRNGNRAVNPRHQDLQGKGDHHVENLKRTQEKQMGRTITTGLNYINEKHV